MDLFSDLSEKQREAVETINDDLEIIALQVQEKQVL